MEMEFHIPDVLFVAPTYHELPALVDINRFPAVDPVAPIDAAMILPFAEHATDCQDLPYPAGVSATLNDAPLFVEIYKLPGEFHAAKMYCPVVLDTATEPTTFPEVPAAAVQVIPLFVEV
jgi:hypothetical protein